MADLVYVEWLFRHEALSQLGHPLDSRLRNYEIEIDLNERRGLPDGQSVGIKEPCPFHAQWSSWKATDDGKAYAAAYNARTKALYSSTLCGGCGEGFGGYGHRGARWSGPNWDGTCQSCGHQVQPPPGPELDLSKFVKSPMPHARAH